MPYIIRQNQSYWVLAACFVLIALLSRLNSPTPTYYTYGDSTRPASQQEIQREALQNTVSGAIGIQEERGDSVFVVVKQ